MDTNKGRPAPLTVEDLLTVSYGALKFFGARVRDGLEFSLEDLDIAPRTARHYLKELKDAGIIEVEHQRHGPIKITPLREESIQEHSAAAQFIRMFRETPAGQHYKNFDASDYADLREKFPELKDFDFHLRTALKSAHRAERRVPESSLIAYITPHLQKLYERQKKEGEVLPEGPRAFDDPEEEAEFRRTLAEQKEEEKYKVEKEWPKGPFYGINFGEWIREQERKTGRTLGRRGR